MHQTESEISAQISVITWLVLHSLADWLLKTEQNCLSWQRLDHLSQVALRFISLTERFPTPPSISWCRQPHTPIPNLQTHQSALL